MLNDVRHRLRIASLSLVTLVLCLQVIGCRHVNSGRVVPPTAVDPPMIIYFEAHPNRIESGTGEPGALKWETANAVKVHLSHFGQVPPSGSRPLPLKCQGPITYKLTATNSVGVPVSQEETVGCVIYKREGGGPGPRPMVPRPNIMR